MKDLHAFKTGKYAYKEFVATVEYYDDKGFDILGKCSECKVRAGIIHMLTNTESHTD
jgi:hypothetical protein